MKVLVTGATGFVGRAVVAALAADGDEVRAAVRHAPSPPLPGVAVVLHGDLAGPIDWAPLLAGMDCVVHPAGIAHAGPGIAEERYDQVNHRATEWLAVAARAASIARFVFVSSIRARTGPTADHIVTESDEPRPTDPYGRSKIAAERAVQRSGVPFTIYDAGVKATCGR
jgi:UDP-glucose 4-epimerase